MYCTNCGSYFDVARKVYDTEELWGSLVQRVDSVCCPYCLSENIIEESEIQEHKAKEILKEELLEYGVNLDESDIEHIVKEIFENI